MQSLTLSDLAKLTGLKPRTLQFWTANGVLIPDEGTKHGGPGVHRKYGINDVTIACIVAEISQYGLQIGMLISISRQLREVFSCVNKYNIKRYGDICNVFISQLTEGNYRDENNLHILSAILVAVEGTHETRLIIYIDDDGVKLSASTDLENREDEPDCASFLTINLSRILPKMRS